MMSANASALPCIGFDAISSGSAIAVSRTNAVAGP